MNSDKPVDLNEKLDYLHQKIDEVNCQLRTSGNFELKMKFIDYVDNCIEQIYNLDKNKNVK
jgi:2,3-bisphosphoglycerate-independent phosphoglycerate mutase